MQQTPFIKQPTPFTCNFFLSSLNHLSNFTDNLSALTFMVYSALSMRFNLSFSAVFKHAITLPLLKKTFLDLSLQSIHCLISLFL